MTHSITLPSVGAEVLVDVGIVSLEVSVDVVVVVDFPSPWIIM